MLCGKNENLTWKGKRQENINSWIIVDEGYGDIVDPGYGDIVDPGYGDIVDPGYGDIVDPGYGDIVDPGYGDIVVPANVSSPCSSHTRKKCYENKDR